MHSQRFFVYAPLVFALSAGSAAAQGPPVFHLLGRSGGEFPGRPGSIFEDKVGSPFLGARSFDGNGDLFFVGRGRSPDGSTFSDLLVYRRDTQVVEPFIRSGEVIGGFPATVFWGAVGGAQPGVLAHIALLKDPVFGDREAIVVSHPDGSRFVAARDLDQPPGYPLPAGFTDVGLTSGSFLDVNMNRAGTVAYGARFIDQTNVTRYGYYLTRPGGVPERIIDSTMPVPGHPAAQWAAYDGSSSPFDLYTPGLDGAGNAFFRAKYREGAKDYRAFYERSVDGSFRVIADAALTTQVPDRPGHSFFRVRHAANNQRSDVAFAAEIYTPTGVPVGTGVFLERAGQPLAKVLSVGDAVPGIPEATDISVGLSSMNDTGHLLLTVNYFLSFPTGNLGGQSLVLYNPDGSAEPVLRFDHTPGFPGERAGGAPPAEINSAGDVLFLTRMNTSTTKLAAFVYLNQSDTLLPILKTGDTLDGLTVVSFLLGAGSPGIDPMGAIAASSGAVSWDDARNFTLSVILKDATGATSEALYTVQIPAPACPSDFDRNTFVNGDDFDAFMWVFVRGEPAADFDGDSFVTGKDYDGYVEAFAAGC